MADADVIPTPKFTRVGEGYVRFTKVFLDFPQDDAEQAAESELKRFFDRDLPRRNDDSAAHIAIGARLIWNNGSMDSRIPAPARDSALASNEGYILLVEKEAVDILAKTKAGVFYGVTTLLQLVEKNGSIYNIHRLAIADYPVLRNSTRKEALAEMALFRKVTLEELNRTRANTLAERIGIEITEVGDDYLKGRMPVDYRTLQPYGIMHGGASAALAETLGSIAGSLVLDPEKEYCVGMEINANHIRSVQSGYVVGKATPIHVGRTTQVWQIRIETEDGNLVCISRLTLAVIGRRGLNIS